jgi:uracil-DNA glycosylase family 4
MSSDFNSSELNALIEEALSDNIKPADRTYGQLGFMETELVSKLFESIDKTMPDSKFLEIVQHARIDTVANSNKLKITDLHTVTHNCRKCEFSGISPQLPKWNVINPDVVFIIDSSAMDQQASALFVSALKSSGFSSENVCLTYLLRCPTRSIEPEYINNCVNYLHNEIQIMNPKLLCPIGANALSALFGLDSKLKDYKNKITWLGSWPILPLYSLNYVLKAGDTALQSFQSDMDQAYQFCYKKVIKNDTD